MAWYRTYQDASWREQQRACSWWWGRLSPAWPPGAAARGAATCGWGSGRSAGSTPPPPPVGINNKDMLAIYRTGTAPPYWPILAQYRYQYRKGTYIHNKNYNYQPIHSRQCCGSGFVFYGSGSWNISPIRIRIQEKKHIFSKVDFYSSISLTGSGSSLAIWIRIHPDPDPQHW